MYEVHLNVYVGKTPTYKLYYPRSVANTNQAAKSRNSVGTEPRLHGFEFYRGPWAR